MRWGVSVHETQTQQVLLWSHVMFSLWVLAPEAPEVSKHLPVCTNPSALSGGSDPNLQVRDLEIRLQNSPILEA